MINAKKRLRVFQRDGFICKICKTNKELTIDHIVPLSQGGTDIESNLRTLCRKCNSERGDYAPSFFERIMYLVFTRKDANRLKHEIIGTIASRESNLKVEINKKLDDFKSLIGGQLSSLNKPESNTQFSVQVVGIKNTVNAYKDKSFERDNKLLNIIYLMAERLEELENKLN